jgi:hypothetical protein
MREYYLIFPLWFCELLEPIEYKTDKDYGEGYYGHWYGCPVYYVPNKVPEKFYITYKDDIEERLEEILNGL